MQSAGNMERKRLDDLKEKERLTLVQKGDETYRRVRITCSRGKEGNQIAGTCRQVERKK